MDKTDYAPGTPSWIDVGVPDIDAAIAFYGALFGWEIPPGDPDAGGYRIAHLGGKTVAGLGPQMSPGPPAWTTYVSTDDVDALATRIVAAGGSIVMEPMDVFDQGRMLLAFDDAGTFFGAWQPLAHRGAQVVNEPGSLAWNELTTRAPDQAKAFYGAVFGWTPSDHPMGDRGSYTEWQLDGRSIGGMLPMGPEFPAEVPNHWLVYFSVADVEAAASKIGELGGNVQVPPFETPAGRAAVVVDPAGTRFAIIALTDPVTT